MTNQDYFAAAAPLLVQNGYLVIQVLPGQKRPRGNDWQRQRNTLDDVARAIANGYGGDNVGVLTGVGDAPVCLIDIDCHDASLVAELRDWCDKHLGFGIERVGLAPKSGLVYRCPGGLTKIASPAYQDSGGRKARVEVLLAGQQFVAYGRHPDGHEYSQPGLITLADTPVGELPLVSHEQLMAVVAKFEDMAEARGWQKATRQARAARPPARVADGDDDDGIPDPPTDLTPDQIRALIALFDAEEYDDWLSMGMALHHQFGGAEEGLDIWDEWSSTASTYTGREALELKWASFGQGGRRSITLRSYLAEARRMQMDRAKAAVRAEKEAREAEIAACDDLHELLNGVAQRAGLAAEAYPELQAMLEARIREQYRALTRATLPVGQVRAAMRPRRRAGGHGGALPHLLTEDQRKAIAALRLPGEGDEEGRRYHATLGNLHAVLTRPECCGAELCFDDFLGDSMIRDETVRGPDGEPAWRPLKDSDMVLLRMRLENGGRPGGFETIGRELMRDAVRAVCESQVRDSAQEWLDSLPEWDGVPRIERFFSRYVNAEDTEYTRAVGLYLWTAMAGRVREPGCQVDMVVTMIGEQGSGKTSLVMGLVDRPERYVEIHLGKRDDDMARLIRGKLVGELGELKGMRQRELGDLKAFLTRRVEEWTPKFVEMSRIYRRRIVLIGTANEIEYLDDATGNRRHLPVVVGRSDLVALKRDLLQLWAEADALWKLEGVLWQDAARLAPTVHTRHEVSDPWEEPVARWLEGSDDLSDPKNGARRCDDPDGIGLVELASGAVGVANGHVDRKVQLRLAKILRGLGYDKRVKRVRGVLGKRWFRPGHSYR